MSAALRVEWWKIRRSRVVATATSLMAVAIPAMGLGFYRVALDGGTGVLSAKADAFLFDDSWLGYLRLVDQIVAVAVFLGVGIVAAWVFGREHADRTFSALFGMAVPRAGIAVAKFVVVLAWAAAVSVAIVIVSFALGLLAVPGVAGVEEVVPELARLLMISLGASLLGLTVALAASLGRGYLPAVGALVVVVAVTQMAVLFGTGAWFPFAVPGLAAVAGAEGVPELSALQILGVPALTAALVATTVAWWSRAEVV